ncbi:hypothetical protein ACHWQZ_G000015 [Mnemiopsis leidyi]
MEEHKDNIVKEAVSLTTQTFPQKIIELHNIVNNEQFALSSMSKVRECPMIEKNQIQINSYLAKCGEILGPVLTEMREHMITLKLWLTVLKAKHDNGDSLGAEVQNELMNMVLDSEEFATSNYIFMLGLKAQPERCGMIANLRHKRRFPRIIPKIRLKQKPKIEHIVLETIRMYDESSFIRLVETVEHTYYTYLRIHDYIEKNKDKITTPRQEHNPDFMM